MRKGKRFLILLWVAAMILLQPSFALADNCSSLLDCFSTAAAAAAAAAGAGATAAMGALPKVQRRKLDPCKVKDYLFWLAIIVTIVFALIAIWLLNKLWAILVIIAAGGPLTIASGVLMLLLAAVLAVLALLTYLMWSEYFRYKKLCQAATTQGGTPPGGTP